MNMRCTIETREDGKCECADKFELSTSNVGHCTERLYTSLNAKQQQEQVDLQKFAEWENELARGLSRWWIPLTSVASGVGVFLVGCTSQKLKNVCLKQ
jgi:ribosomal protein L33